MLSRRAWSWLLNAMAGLSTAYACSSPVLCFAGQTPSGTIDANLGLLHEINNQLEIVKAVVTWSGRAERGEDIPQLVTQAIEEMMSGRTRPVAIEVSPDVLAAECARPSASPVAKIDPPGPPVRQGRARSTHHRTRRTPAHHRWRRREPVVRVGPGYRLGGAAGSSGDHDHQRERIDLST